jgi:hypothetical protein
MPELQSIAQAGLVDWRKSVAERIAPRAAPRAPVSEEQDLPRHGHKHRTMSFGGDSASGDFNRQGRRHALARISARLQHKRPLA